MAELLKHDFNLLAYHKRNFLIIGLGLPLGFYILDPGLDLYIHPVLSILVFLIGIFMSITNESSGVLINSLPTNKVEMVKSRFIFMSLCTIVITIYLLLVVYLLRNTGHGVYIQNSNNILAFFSTSFSTLAFLMPIGFLSNKVLDVVSMIILFVTMGSSWILWEVVTKHVLIFAIVAMVLLICSYLMSISIFNEREFD